MKILKKSILIFGAVVFLVLAGISASAVTEGTGDVYHGTMTSGTWSYVAFSESRPDIDITSVDYSVSGSDITVTLTVSGSIQVSENFTYYIYLLSEVGTYYIGYMNGYSTWVGLDGYASEMGIITDPIVDGDTFTATFTPNNPSDSFSVYGYAVEAIYTDTEAGNAEWYLDYAPDIYSPWYTGGDDDTPDDEDDDTPPADDENPDDSEGDTQGGDSDSGTPGFEAIILIAAIAVALILLRRKKN